VGSPFSIFGVGKTLQIISKIKIIPYASTLAETGDDF